MVNMSARRTAASRAQFIEEFASLLSLFGMASTTARVFAYVLLKNERVSVDQIAADLGVSRVSAWKAARQLEESRHLRRHGESGSKRALYTPAENFWAPLVRQGDLLMALSALLDRGARDVASGESIQRLREMAQFCRAMRQALDEALQQFEVRRSAPQRRVAKRSA
jgi:DNA-binding Lrp family transcriptional regulator